MWKINAGKSMLEQYSGGPKCPKPSTAFYTGRGYGAE